MVGRLCHTVQREICRQAYRAVQSFAAAGFGPLRLQVRKMFARIGSANEPWNAHSAQRILAGVLRAVAIATVAAVRRPRGITN